MRRRFLLRSVALTLIQTKMGVPGHCVCTCSGQYSASRVSSNKVLPCSLESFPPVHLFASSVHVLQRVHALILIYTLTDCSVLEPPLLLTHRYMHFITSMLLAALSVSRGSILLLLTPAHALTGVGMKSSPLTPEHMNFLHSFIIGHPCAADPHEPALLMQCLYPWS